MTGRRVVIRCVVSHCPHLQRTQTHLATEPDGFIQRAQILPELEEDLGYWAATQVGSKVLFQELIQALLSSSCKDQLPLTDSLHICDRDTAAAQACVLYPQVTNDFQGRTLSGSALFKHLALHQSAWRSKQTSFYTSLYCDMAVPWEEQLLAQQSSRKPLELFF